MRFLLQIPQTLGFLRLIVDKPDEAEKALKAAGLTVSLTDVIAIGIPNTPGGFAVAARALADASVTIEYMYAFISPEQGRAWVILRVDDNDKATVALQEHDIEILGEDKVYRLLNRNNNKTTCGKTLFPQVVLLLFSFQKPFGLIFQGHLFYFEMHFFPCGGVGEVHQ